MAQNNPSAMHPKGDVLPTCFPDSVVNDKEIAAGPAGNHAVAIEEGSRVYGCQSSCRASGALSGVGSRWRLESFRTRTVSWTHRFSRPVSGHGVGHGVGPQVFKGNGVGNGVGPQVFKGNGVGPQVFNACQDEVELRNRKGFLSSTFLICK